MKNLLFTACVTILAPLSTQAEDSSTKRPNVLFIAVDDWNDWAGCMGHKQAKTPNVDRLAARGMLFKNASCAASVCNPSRAAVMSGLRPHTTGIYENATPLQTQIPSGHLTLPKYFRKHGYIAKASGKIYHDQIGGHPHDDFDHYHFWNEHYRSWGWELGYSRFPDPEPVKRPFSKITSKTKRNFDFGTISGKESEMPDFQSNSFGVNFLKQKHDKPFFLAIGQFKPHIPWFAPKKYFDMYPLDSIELPPTKEDDLDDLPKIALKRTNDKASQHHLVKEFDEWKKAVQGYLACISFADAQIGRLLDALDASPYKDNTIIVLWSDHGYHLGEKSHWHKRTLWERSVRVPYIIVAPGVTTPGSSTNAPVDLMSVYPTLTKLCNLPPNPQIEGEGNSVFPLIKKPTTNWPHYALCTHQRGNHTVRSTRYRYIRYNDGSEELYDHSNDPNEWHNLAAKPTDKIKRIMEDHAKHLPKNEAPIGPSYKSGSVLMKLTGNTYEWKTKKDAQGDPEFKNAAKLKSQAWAAAKEKQ